MAKRTVLQQQLTEAWRATINGAYEEALINSERGLQLHFCMNLMRRLEEQGVKNRRLFIEPTFVFNGERRSPDLVICNYRSIIGVVEFKYRPVRAPVPSGVRKDFETLKAAFEAHKSGLAVQNKRYQGLKPCTAKYSIRDDVVLCWACVHPAGWSHEHADVANEFGDQYLELTAGASKTGVKLGIPESLLDGV